MIRSRDSSTNSVISLIIYKKLIYGKLINFNYVACHLTSSFAIREPNWHIKELHRNVRNENSLGVIIIMSFIGWRVVICLWNFVSMTAKTSTAMLTLSIHSLSVCATLVSTAHWCLTFSKPFVVSFWTKTKQQRQQTHISSLANNFSHQRIVHTHVLSKQNRFTPKKTSLSNWSVS